MRYGFARLTLFSSPGEKPAEVELQDIFVCPHAQRVSLQDLSQILLHEIYHSVGWIDECDTTYYELMSHRLAKKKAHHNAHAARCGWGSIAEYRDVEYER